MKTVEVFLSEGNMSTLLARKILNNVKSCEKLEMVMNLISLDFDFESKSVLLSYYVKDNDYPDVILTFDELRGMLKQ